MSHNQHIISQMQEITSLFLQKRGKERRRQEEEEERIHFPKDSIFRNVEKCMSYDIWKQIPKVDVSD